jgi:hypothetical protein
MQVDCVGYAALTPQEQHDLAKHGLVHEATARPVVWIIPYINNGRWPYRNQQALQQRIAQDGGYTHIVIKLCLPPLLSAHERTTQTTAIRDHIQTTLGLPNPIPCGTDWSQIVSFLPSLKRSQQQHGHQQLQVSTPWYIERAAIQESIQRLAHEQAILQQQVLQSRHESNHYQEQCRVLEQHMAAYAKAFT